MSVAGVATVADEQLITDDLQGGVSALDLGALPARVDVVAYHRDANGDHLFAVDTAVSLPGAVIAGTRE